MKQAQTINLSTPGRLARSRRLPLKRLLAQLWGTTSNADILAALAMMFRRDQLVQGSSIEQYEQAFAERVGVRHALSFSSGRVALYGLLRALEVGEGDEVLLQVPTHIVVANAIRYTGARPVYVDCELNTFNMDLEQAERLITPRTKVLLLQHTFGIPANPQAARELADKHGLVLIEDCVHALGATQDGRPVGSFGQAAFFSTEETKIISSTMGGMAVTDNDELAARLKSFQESSPWPTESLVKRYLLKMIVYHLFAHPYLHPYTRNIYMNLRRSPKTHLAPGATSLEEQEGHKPAQYEQRLSNAQAMIALRQLRRLDQNLAHRRRTAEAYRQRLSSLGYPVQKIAPGSEPAYVRFPIMVKEREPAMRVASSRVVLGQWFNSVLEESTHPSDGEYAKNSCPNAEFVAEHLVNLPTHLRVQQGDVEEISAILAGLEPAKVE